MKRLGALLLLLALASGAAADGDDVAYPAAPGLAAVLESDDERALKDAALAALDAGGRESVWGTRLLFLLGDVPGGQAPAARPGGAAALHC